ncbi:MAG TPA: phage tail protein [Pyrinomonadaceae bacterium]|jgi:phage tail-like protein|nr:phage tail protein [Pyrinomonadaceae bacterium]
MADPATPQPAAPAAAMNTFIDPYRAYNFKMDILGITEAHFTEVSNMEIKVNPIAYREGGGQVVHYVPGYVEYGTITLRYGLTKSRELWDWFMSGAKGKVERKNISIILLDADGTTSVMQWNLRDAWPTHWRGSMLNALSQEVAIESLTLVCETIERD